MAKVRCPPKSVHAVVMSKCYSHARIEIEDAQCNYCVLVQQDESRHNKMSFAGRSEESGHHGVPDQTTCLDCITMVPNHCLAPDVALSTVRGS